MCLHDGVVTLWPGLTLPFRNGIQTLLEQRHGFVRHFKEVGWPRHHSQLVHSVMLNRNGIYYFMIEHYCRVIAARDFRPLNRLIKPSESISCATKNTGHLPHWEVLLRYAAKVCMLAVMDRRDSGLSQRRLTDHCKALTRLESVSRLASPVPTIKQSRLAGLHEMVPIM